MTLAEVVQGAEEAPEGEHFLFRDVTWAFYRHTVDELVRTGQHARVTYDQGSMEIMTTSGWHEGIKTAVARLLEHYSFVVDVPIQGLGGLTCMRDDVEKGLEPDECYFIHAKPVLDSTGHIDLIHGPPPELVIEVEVTRSSIPKRPIYVAMRVPEIWRINAQELIVMRLEGAEYMPVERSSYFPQLNIMQFFQFVNLAIENQHEGVKAFDAWLRGPGATK
jgi:Uma2 family endonuclease